MKSKPDASWRCYDCLNPVVLSEDEKKRQDTFMAAQKLLDKRANRQGMRKRSLLHMNRELIEPFVDKRRLDQLERDVFREQKALDKEAMEDGEGSSSSSATMAAWPKTGRACDSTTPSFTTATLREYQVDGVNWMTSGYDAGIGGILGDQMGLGKTLQTLTFLAYLKKVYGSAGGPHLVVAPLAVYQNWANECKQFTPSLTFFKLHVSASERSRLSRAPTSPMASTTSTSPRMRRSKLARTFSPRRSRAGRCSLWTRRTTSKTRAAG